MHVTCDNWCTHVLVAVHAQTLDLVNDPGIVLVLLSACFGDLTAHILEEILRETLFCGHDVLCVDICGKKGCVVVYRKSRNSWRGADSVTKFSRLRNSGGLWRTWRGTWNLLFRPWSFCSPTGSHAKVHQVKTTLI